MQVRQPASSASTRQPPRSGAGAGRPREASTAVAFLTALDLDESLVGGLLMLNPAARPLEFHCTAPVRPSRAQEILYGPTLRPFLIGEQIGATLLAKAQATPGFVVTDCEAMLAARGSQDAPIACLVDDTAAETLKLGEFQVAASRAFPEDRDRLPGLWSGLPQELDLREPFARIREAIGEAQKSRKAG